MKIRFELNDTNYEANLNEPLDISIPLKQGEDNPNCYWAETPVFETIVSGDFIGSVKEGGSVNYQKISVTPHGNGTHTECYGHISEDGATINNSLKQFHFPAELISVEPREVDGDYVILKSDIKEKITSKSIKGIIIRTLPNSDDKKVRKYSGTNPPYLEADALKFLADMNVMHLLVDLPSVDRESDEGRLTGHRSFWKFPDETRKSATITELVFVPLEIEDSIYLVNLQIISLETDACPSKPLLYRIRKI